MRSADRLRVGLRDEVRRLLRGVHAVRHRVQRPRARGHPGLVRGDGGGQGQVVPHPVVRVAGGDVQPTRERVVLHGGAVVRDARGDELVLARVLADDVGLPADEVRGELRLELAPRQGVLGLGVVLRRPEVRPGGEPVGPVGQAPLLVQPLDRAVPGAQVVHEPLEDLPVVEDLVARLVVHLVPDDGGVLGVPGDDGADDPLGMEQERRVAVVDLLTRAPAHRRPVPADDVDLRVQPRQPHRHRVGRRTEDHLDAPLVRAVQHGLQPVQVEAAVLRLPGGPDGLADPDHREARLDHQVQVPFQLPGALLLGAVVLVVVGGAEQDPVVQVVQCAHGCLSGGDAQ